MSAYVLYLTEAQQVCRYGIDANPDPLQDRLETNESALDSRLGGGSLFGRELEEEGLYLVDARDQTGACQSIVVSGHGRATTDTCQPPSTRNPV